MKILVTFRHLDPSDALKSYVEEKLSKLKKYVIPPVEVNVVLSVEKFRHIAEVTLIANRTTLKSREETSDMYAAIDGVAAKMERQVKKFKEKLKQHPGIEHDGFEYLARKADGGLQVEKIVAENMNPERMSVEEAILVLERREMEFYVFTNASSNSVNIVHRLKDGQYGLIEVEAATS